MVVTWFPGGKRNRAVEVLWGVRGKYDFSLCRRQETEDASTFRLFVYVVVDGYQCFRHLGGYDTVEAAQEAAHQFAEEGRP